jgi:Orange carotenoid protein, N-terminal
MTSTNVSFIDEAALKFEKLDADTKLGVLALLYDQLVDEIPVGAVDFDSVPQEATNLLTNLQQIPQSEQLEAMRGLLESENHNTDISVQDHSSLDSDSKLIFWFQLAKNLGKSIIGVPSDYIPSEEVTEILDLLESTNIDNFVAFLKRVL